MRKHPIDEIFKGKLTDVERRPSAAAWKRIYQEQKTRESRVWVWFAAAGVLVAFMAGYLVWVNRQDAVKVQWTKATPVMVQPDSIQSQPLMGPETEQVQVAVKTNVGTVKILQADRAAPVIAKIQPVQEEISTTTVAFEELPVLIQPVEPQAMPKEIPQLAIVETSPPRHESRTIMVKVEEAAEIQEEKDKSSRLGRIFRQLKNAKQGELVDWEEVGFNPKTLVARVDDKLRNGEEKVVEKYQNLKEKTKL